MKNELFTIGPFTVYSYGFMIAVGVFAAWLTAEYRAKKYRADTDQIFFLVLWCLVGGLLGAKLLFWITEWKEVAADPGFILRTMTDGFVVYGGIIGGIIAGWLYSRITKLNFLKYFDLMIPSVALAQGFGRIGCLLAGCCYGRETDLPIGVIFPEGALAPAGIRLLPTQLISSAGNFLIMAILLATYPRRKRKGDTGFLYMLLYGVGRFLIEFLRNDERGAVGGLSTSQFISLFIVAAGILLMCNKRRALVEAAGQTGADGKTDTE